jgi:hypothetical protein
MAKLTPQERLNLCKGYNDSPTHYYEVSNNKGDHFVGEVRDSRKTKSSILGFLKKATGGLVEPSDSAPDSQKRNFEKDASNRWKIRVEEVDYTEEDCSPVEEGEHDDGWQDVGEEETGFLGWLGWGK